VTNRVDAGSVVAKLFGGPAGGFGVEKSMSSAASRNSCLASSAVSVTPALRAAEYSSPAMPDACPVASYEHEFDEIDSHVYPPKFVHPLNARYVLGA
jgi:hypothetical protein